MRAVRVDDIIETTNHFRCIDFIIDRAEEPLTESMIKQLHGYEIRHIRCFKIMVRSGRI